MIHVILVQCPFNCPLMNGGCYVQYKQKKKKQATELNSRKYQYRTMTCFNFDRHVEITA